MMARRHDWPQRLAAAIEQHRDRPFEWGASDCVTFPMDCVLAMTGEDPIEGERDYSTELGAARNLRRRGVETVAEAFAAVFVEIPVAMAHRGDLMIVEHGGRHGGGVCIGAAVVCKSEDGICVLPRSAAARAFRVG